ncbi:MAG: hypothetical protein AAFV53_19530 [Myxococcota bacterium]
MRLLVFVIILLTGCATLNPARPLNPGEHAVGATLGGPAFAFGGAPLPMPNIVIEGRSGITTISDRPLDVNYGLNLTGTVFGIAGVHGGAAWMLSEQRQGVPAFTISDRQYLYTNVLDPRKEDRGGLAVNQLELTASWQVQRTLLYAGVAEYLVFSEPSLLLTPFIGAQRAIGASWMLQLEGRHYAINRTENFDSIQWITYGPGALGLNIGFARTFGGTP